VLAVAAVLLVATQPALAHAAEPATSVLAQGQTSGQVEQLIQRATNWLTGLLAALASLYVVMAGVRYLCSGGKPAEVAHAKEALKSAGIGYGIAALAQLVVQILTELVGQ
jgi:Type IV secretion system pilin